MLSEWAGVSRWGSGAWPPVRSRDRAFPFFTLRAYVPRPHYASTSLQYATHLPTSATDVEPAGILYSSSMSA
jgi:hypothetical protein